jgi:GT2 family glycosyltransferase
MTASEEAAVSLAEDSLQEETEQDSAEEVVGFIDLYGYASAAGGYCFSGWIKRPSRTVHGITADITAQFEQGEVKAAAIMSFFHRADLTGRNVGVVIFFHASARNFGDLLNLSIRVDDKAYRANAGMTTEHLRDKDLTDRMRAILVERAFVDDNRRQLISIVSRRGYTGEDTVAGLADPVLLEIDEAVLCPPDGILVMGWHLSAPGTMRSLRVRCGAASSDVTPQTSFRVSRPDVLDAIGKDFGFMDLRCGFVAFAPGIFVEGLDPYLEVETSAGEVAFKGLKISKRRGIGAIKRILESFESHYGEIDAAFDNVIGPAVKSLNSDRLREPAIADEISFGEVNPTPECTILVPLFGRIDFLEYQMAFFSKTDAYRNHELIYVLDDPPKRTELEFLAQSTYERFEIPFRILFLPRNLGFAPANNVGLRAARGNYICFMNSDVFPGDDNWLDRLIARLVENPKIGIIGPRLLFEDGSVQHEGCTFRKVPEFGNWNFIDHVNKARRPEGRTGLAQSEVITGACMILARSVAEEMGGFDESFVIGDFEDSDLCLRVRAKGLDIAVDRDVTLYHLERQSQGTQSDRGRSNLTLYNAWLHQRRWFGTETTVHGER